MSEFTNAKAEARNNTDTSGPILQRPSRWVVFQFPAHSRPAHSLYKASLTLLRPHPPLIIMSMTDT